MNGETEYSNLARKKLFSAKSGTDRFLALDLHRFYVKLCKKKLKARFA